MIAKFVRLGLTALAVIIWVTASASADDVIRFGAAVSLTGPLSTEAKQMKDGYDFYVKQINVIGASSDQVFIRKTTASAGSSIWRNSRRGRPLPQTSTVSRPLLTAASIFASNAGRTWLVSRSKLSLGP
jgi:hypothetical protein